MGAPERRTAYAFGKVLQKMKSFRLTLALLLGLLTGACSGSSDAPAPSPPAPGPPPVPAGPPKPLEAATIRITASGFRLDAASAALFDINDLHVYQGGRLTFINDDSDPHDVLSSPFGLHNDCPEINAAGFLVPGQSRATDPLTHLSPCGFHDHTHEGNPAYGGRVTAEPR
jgi:hypothetical protein